MILFPRRGLKDISAIFPTSWIRSVRRLSTTTHHSSRFLSVNRGYVVVNGTTDGSTGGLRSQRAVEINKWQEKRSKEVKEKEGERERERKSERK